MLDSNTQINQAGKHTNPAKYYLNLKSSDHVRWQERWESMLCEV